MPEDEQAIDPNRPIIDPHLHLWEIREAPGSPQLAQRFLLDELQAAIAASGHRITHTVFVECHQMYRQDGPEELRSLGETEFANGMAAMSASGNYGPCEVAHRIVASADLRLGAQVRPVLEAHRDRAGERFRGIRMNTAFSEAGLFGFPCDPSARELLRDPGYVEGARILQEMGLSLDVWCLHSQLDQLAELADALPDLAIILNHVGTPDPHTPGPQARKEWAQRIADIASRPNVVVKIGGMGMNLTGQIGQSFREASSEILAEEWRPFVETCIEAFTPARAMFESNFPPDNAAGSYGATWNAFKILSQGLSDVEKDELFRGTASRTYRIDL